jgi:hypothetical protein
MTARGIRNHNPGNLRKSADKWQGLASKQPDPEFFTFTSPEMGIRALARTIITYYDKYDLNTVNKIIGRWAPPNENNTQAYANAVAKQMGVATNMEFDAHAYYYLSRLVPAIIRHENGEMPYTKAQIDRGLALAGVLPETPKATVAKSRTVQAGTVATGSTAGAGLVEGLQQASDGLSMLTPYLEAAKWAFLAITLLSVGYMIYRRWDQDRRLIR